LKITRLYCEKLPSSFSEIGPIVRDVLNDIQKHLGPLKEHSLFELRVILSEIVMNAVKHGNMEEGCKYIKVGVYGIDNGFVSLVVEDEGEGYDYEMQLSRCTCPEDCDRLDMLEESGRGMLLVKGLSDKVKVNSKGNRISVLKKIERV
jgi:serine/threonine-protein kinase RsbW